MNQMLEQQLVLSFERFCKGSTYNQFGAVEQLSIAFDKGLHEIAKSIDNLADAIRERESDG
jgi:hypothetical protein